MDYISVFESLNCPYIENEPMSRHTTFKIGGPCDYLVEPENIEVLKELILRLKENGLEYYILGNGSNLLVSDLGISGAVIKIGSKLSEITLTDSNTISALAGAKLSSLCNFAYEQSINGFQYLWGIPATVGGAIYMNAGAYGGDIKTVIKNCTFINNDGKIETLSKEDLNLNYRESIFKSNGGIILSAEFEGAFGNKAQIRLEMDELMARRKAKQPLEWPSAGSTFKRPKDNYAGTLIESSGLKGFSVGDAMVSEKHAGFIINKGEATASDVRILIEKVKEKVFLTHSIKLESEVIFIGR